MKLTGPLVTRLHNDYSHLIGKTAVVLSVSTVTVAPPSYKGKAYQVAVVDLDDGGKGSYQVAEGQNLNIGDKVKIVLKYGYESLDGLKLYIPKLIKHG